MVRAKIALALDFGDIKVGDTAILCRDSALQSAAYIKEVLDEEDIDGLPVRILRGEVPWRFSRESIAAINGALVRDGLSSLRLATGRGFKQGAFCQRLDVAQAEYLLKLARPSQTPA